MSIGRGTDNARSNPMESLHALESVIAWKINLDQKLRTKEDCHCMHGYTNIITFCAFHLMHEAANFGNLCVWDMISTHVSFVTPRLPEYTNHFFSKLCTKNSTDVLVFQLPLHACYKCVPRNPL